MTALRRSRSGRSRAPRVFGGGFAALCVAAGGLAVIAGGMGTSGAASSHGTKSVVVTTSKSAKFGTILVSAKTLYTLNASKTSCAAKCLKYWPELLLPKGVAKATAGTGVSASKLGTITRAGGARQVTYAGKALYWFVKDTAPGQVNGNVSDTWGKWSDVVLIKPTRPVTTTTSSGGGGIGF